MCCCTVEANVRASAASAHGRDHATLPAGPMMRTSQPPGSSATLTV